MSPRTAAVAPEPASAAYLGALVAEARRARLANAPAWRALLHFRTQRLSRQPASLIDEPSFFLSSDGDRDPAAELEATLSAFFAAEPADAVHPQCRYPARYHWLREQLGFDPERLPELRCPALVRWRENFRASRLTLVFPEAYLNNPASAFGHTLLRIDAGDVAEDLLAYGVNFAAHTDGEGGVGYAVKGIFGRYPGYFSVAPYYDLVKRYGDWENRDIWEYELDFEPHEIDQILRHLYELDGVRFDYFFFDENCSYELLDLLEVGRPGTGLLSRDPVWLIPVDSVRRVTRQAGWVRRVRYRPSSATRLRHRASELPGAQQQLALALARGDLAPDASELTALPDPQRGAVLTLAYDALRYRMMRRDETADATRGRALALLAARSRAAPPRDAPEVPVPVVRPEQGHATRRAALETGVWNREPYLEFRLRPAFHQLMDPQGGYTRGAQIQFLDVAVRVLPRRHRVRLQEIRVLDIVSQSPRDRVLRPLSWRLATGLGTRLIPDGEGDLEAASVWRNEAGVGLSYARGSWSGYAFADGLLEFGPELAGSVAVGPGASLGGYCGDERDFWRGHLFAGLTRFVAGETGLVMRGGLEQRLRFGHRMSVSLSTQWERRFHEDRVEGALRWNLYF